MDKIFQIILSNKNLINIFSGEKPTTKWKYGKKALDSSRIYQTSKRRIIKENKYSEDNASFSHFFKTKKLNKRATNFSSNSYNILKDTVLLFNELFNVH